MSETIVIREQSTEVGKRGEFVKIVAPNDEFYFVFDTKLFPLVRGRQSILAEVDRSTQFKRITAVIPSEQTTLPVGPANGRTWSDEPRDQQIARQVSLKAAVEVWCASDTGRVTQTAEATAAATLKLANLYLDWLQGTPF